MKKTSAAIFLLFVCAFLSIAQEQSEWIKYSSTEGRYSVSVPVTPKVSTQETTAATGEKLPQYLASAVEGNGVYMIGYFDIGNMTFSHDKARDGMVSSMNATLISDDEISFNGAPGRSLKLLAKSSDGTEFLDRAKFFAIEKRIFILQCIFPNAEDSPGLVAKCARFFDSFKPEGQ